MKMRGTGEWYRRAYADDGSILGTKDNKECRIDGISQSWSVISGVGEEHKKNKAMESLEKFLINKDARNN